MASSKVNPNRPTSPHLQVWRWHVTMATSIFHRASGVALYVGAILLAGWLAALASGQAGYDAYMALLQSPFGLLVLFGITAAACYHLANGIRHLAWDAGKGYDAKTATMTGWLTIIAGGVGAVLVFALAFLA